MDKSSSGTEKAFFGLLPMVLMLVGPVLCLLCSIVDMSGTGLFLLFVVFVVAVCLLSFGLLTGKVKLFG